MTAPTPLRSGDGLAATDTAGPFSVSEARFRRGSHAPRGSHAHAPREPDAQPPRDSTEARWGLRLATAPPATAPPEPLEWQALPSLRQRLHRAAAVPAIAAAVIFIAVVLVSIATVWLQPHDPGAGDAVAGEASGSGGGAPQLLGDAAAQSPSPAAGEVGAGEDGPDAPGTVFVHVVGEVRHPGVYELPMGERVAAAIEAAGATEDASLSGVNLARRLVDGEQIAVPDADGLVAGVPAEAFAAPPGATPGAGSGTSGPIDLNSADAAALETLPRVGPALAQRILLWRQSNGGFSSTEQLLEVSGIGQKTFEQLSPLVTV